MVAEFLPLFGNGLAALVVPDNGLAAAPGPVLGAGLLRDVGPLAGLGQVNLSLPKQPELLILTSMKKLYAYMI